MKRHTALGSVQHKQLGPDQPQQGHLVSHLKLREAWDVARPLHRAEEYPRCKLANIVNSDHVVGSHLDLSVAGGIGFSPEQERDVGGEVGGSTKRVASETKAKHALGRRHSSSLHGCKSESLYMNTFYTMKNLILSYLLSSCPS